MLRAVIIDDEPATAVIIKAALKKEALPIEIAGTASNGQKAVELIDEAEPDLVFTDIEMPFKSGLEVMRERPDYNYIVITAYELFDYAQEALRLGAKDFLLKPIKYDQLKNAIERAIGWNFTQSQDVNKVLEYVNSHYSESFEVSRMAKEIYTTPTSLARVFKKHMGMSILTYLHTVRINHAVRLLRISDKSIAEISKEVGYENVNNFYKYFKRFNGTTPAEYMNEKQHRAGALSAEG